MQAGSQSGYRLGLGASALRMPPGRMHDQTALRADGIDHLLEPPRHAPSSTSAAPSRRRECR